MGAAADYFGNMGTNIVTGGLNAGLSALMTEHNAATNFKYNEMAAQRADARQRALYEDYMSPAARIRQLQEAGLSPSLYAEGAGGGNGGVPTSAQGAGASGVGMPNNLMDMQGLAEIRLMNAQAHKAETDAKSQEGNTPKGEAEIAALWAKAGLDKAAKLYTEAQTGLANVQLYINDATKDTSIWKIKSDSQRAADDASRAFWEAQSSELKFQFDAATFETRCQEIANSVAELAAKTALEQSQTKLNDAERNAIKDYVYAAVKSADAHADNAKAYGNYVELMCDQMPKQLEMRGKELNVEKWKIGIGAATDLIKSACYVYGGGMIGKGVETVVETATNYDKSGNTRGSTRTERTRTRER